MNIDNFGRKQRAAVYTHLAASVEASNQDSNPVEHYQPQRI